MTDVNNDWVNTIREEQDYREFVGPKDEYDINAAIQFNLLTSLGLRETHKLLEIGCGSLRAGRLFIPYLQKNHYFGIEPETWLVKQAIGNELGQNLIDLKNPSFRHVSDFSCKQFQQEFDFVLIQGVFTHAPERLIRDALGQIVKCIKHETVVAATYFKGNENYLGDEWLYPQTSTFTAKRILEIAQQFGFECTHIKWPHPRKASWVLFYLPNNSEIITNFAQRMENCFEEPNNNQKKLRYYLRAIKNKLVK